MHVGNCNCDPKQEFCTRGERNTRIDSSIVMDTYITVVKATIHPYFAKTGQLTKHPFYRNKKRFLRTFPFYCK
jgi:hypothetical protein